MMGPPMTAGIRVCPGCGIIAPLGRTACSVCNASFGATAPVAPGRLGPMLFACIHGCDFTCSACGKRSPLATIDVSGQVECMCCGITQAFDAVQWTDALGHAHDVVDLAGPSPDGQNPVPGRSIAGKSRHAKIGTEFTSSTKTQNTMIMDGSGTRTHSLRTTVSPGHPLCTACRVPLEVMLDPNGVTRTRCPRCNDGATYALPPDAMATYGSLRGVIAGEQRTDRPVARTARGQGGVEAVVCPQCGAALAAGEGEMVKCTFCSITARVPGKLARRQRQGAPPPMVPFWVLLDGLSPGRKKLLRGRSEDDDDDADDDDDDDDGGAAYAPPGVGAPFVNPGAVPPWAHPNLHRTPRPKSSLMGVIIGISVVVVLVLVGLGVGAALYLQADDDGSPHPATPAATAAPTATATAAAKRKR
ncbi:MAG: hypothetical protein QOI41_764 [Myxococcales bacterium]|nr:hypothetical protein [Myxococcales bacterium]